MNLGEKLRYLRRDKDLTLEKQSELLGVSLNTVYRWEHNLTRPRANVLRKIAKLYNVSPEWLAEENEESLTGGDAGQAAPRDLDTERHLLRMFRSLPTNERYLVLGYAERICLEKER